MVWFDFLWLDGANGSIEHIAEHDLTITDVEYVIENYDEESTSRGSGRPLRFGRIADGRYIAVVFEWVDNVTVYPITAFEVEE